MFQQKRQQPIAYSSYDAYEHEKSFIKNFADEDLNMEK